MEGALKYKVGILCILSLLLGLFLGPRLMPQATLRQPISATELTVGPQVDVSKDRSSRMRHIAMDNSRHVTGKQTSTHADMSGDVAPVSRKSSSFMHQICSQESRVSLYKSACVKHNPEEIVHEILLDQDNKMTVCINKKAGSMSWQTFLARTKNPTFKRSGEGFEVDQKSLGFSRLQRVNSRRLSDQYGDWIKYIVVRHPLQRLVSGYYQIQVGKVVDEDGVKMMPKMTFLEFADGLVNGQLANRNIHWMEYNYRCRVCHVDYEFIVKQETIEQDQELFKELYGFRKDVHVHAGTGNMWVSYSNTSRSFKYDKMLGDFQDEHPDLMRGLLKLYEFDMELFGYGWDWEQKKSFCWNDAASGCC